MDPGASPLAFFGAELRRQRVAAAMSQDDLGRAVMFSTALIGRIEMAERMPSQDFADRCDEALDSGGFFGRFRDLVKREAFPTWFGSPTRRGGGAGGWPSRRPRSRTRLQFSI